MTCSASADSFQSRHNSPVTSKRWTLAMGPWPVALPHGECSPRGLSQHRHGNRCRRDTDPPSVHF